MNFNRAEFYLRIACYLIKVILMKAKDKKIVLPNKDTFEAVVTSNQAYIKQCLKRLDFNISEFCSNCHDTGARLLKSALDNAKEAIPAYEKLLELYERVGCKNPNYDDSLRIYKNRLKELERKAEARLNVYNELLVDCKLYPDSEEILPQDDQLFYNLNLTNGFHNTPNNKGLNQ